MGRDMSGGWANEMEACVIRIKINGNVKIQYSVQFG